MSGPFFANKAVGHTALKAVGSGLRAADRGALHAYDLAKVVAKPGNFEPGRIRTYAAKKNLLWLAVTSPLLLVNDDPRVSGAVNSALQKGQNPMSNTIRYPQGQVKTAAGIRETITNFLTNVGKGGASKVLGKAGGGGGGAHMLGGLGAGAVLGAGGLIGAGIGTAMSGPESTFGYQLSKGPLGNSLWDRVQGDEAFARKFMEGMGSESGKTVVQLAREMAAQGVGAGVDAVSKAPERAGILRNLMDADDILQRADNNEVMGAYSTMERFAPTLATDPNAVRSFLREAATTGGGADYASIANLARAEESVNPWKKHSAVRDGVLSQTAQRNIARAGLHKIAAARLHMEGEPPLDELGMKTAVATLAKKAYVRRVRSRKIHDGLQYLNDALA